MPVYDHFRDMATRLIERFGQEATWNKNENGAPFDPDKPWVPGDTVSTEFPVIMAFLPDTYDQRETLNFTRRSSVPTGTIVGYLGPSVFTPALKDTVKRGDVTYSVENIVEIRPNTEQGIIYILRLK